MLDERSEKEPQMAASTKSLIRIVADAMEHFAPLRFADVSWDNVGVLIENPKPNGHNKILLTIDLSAAVLQECLDKRVEVVIAYHPFIFGGMKKMQLKSPHERMVLETIVNGISVFSPHTSWDAAVGGLNEWLGRVIDPLGKLTTIQPSKDPLAPKGTGYGRVLTLDTPKTLEDIVATIKKEMRVPTARVCAAPDMILQPNQSQRLVNKIAICAGSGSSVFKALREDVDVLFCGEMGHHDVLAAQQAGRSVVLVEHTNNERGFLEAVVAPWLKEHMLAVSPETAVCVSECDRDPLTVW